MPNSKHTITEHEAREAFEKAQKAVKPSHFDEVIKKAEEIMSKFEEIPVLGKYLKHAPTMLGIVKDFFQGRYKDVPYASIVAIVAALIYLLSPIDLIPDAIPGVGYVDDAMVIGLCLNFVMGDLDKYRAWRDSQYS